LMAKVDRTGEWSLTIDVSSDTDSIKS